ncbi:segregation and condensation protein A [Breznakia sp. PF5-3]|uniref:segregation and condensation protein A n=1 Tax=unclassified Breznakia TaxID=2623764 RepID=UPI00240654B7|nr:MULTISPECIES: segregation/condensation protein A [unclassified Breznakia]MDL2276947.1 segregation/condensation protein A [Breznakia sp. OttesenSCG-928-G09]MDF9825332.1 segregation and condensation protein A [Breznakia sp. PM6-1]MDF9836187.1 segregation and condensation protein A [Breznakia sp. PF5-3]MDF9838415.1 segregation and condensation protein A [Breznakia sp. PFB2-8]MDF9860431.1 segregation and condensation protein A [Breznakia sp. PH5-24]
MAFEITVDQFEGPLDLMLHLIKENKLDLFDLDMTILCDQYLAYINAFESMHLEVASEFLSELAGLIEYKSKRLLPREKVEIAEEYEEDQRDKLVKRLIEYQKFKEASTQFSKSYEERQRMMEKPISKKTEEWMKQVTIDEYHGNPYDLIKAMNRVIRRYELNQPLETQITMKEMSVDERLDQLKTKLHKIKGKITFEQLCDDCKNLHMVIVSFLAILDLIKNQEISFSVDEEDQIWLITGV